MINLHFTLLKHSARKSYSNINIVKHNQKSNMSTLQKPILHKFSIKYNLYYAIATVSILSVLLSLSYWQYQRGIYKQQLLLKQQTLSSQPPTNLQELENKLLDGFNYQDHRFRKVKLTGYFEGKDFLIDNQNYNKIVGYRVLSLFKPSHSNNYILIDRGFIDRKSAKSLNRVTSNTLEANNNTILESSSFATSTPNKATSLDYHTHYHSNNNQQISRLMTIDGIINQPATGILLKADDFKFEEFPIVLQSVDYKLISKNLKINLLPITIQLNQDSEYNFQHITANSNINPAKHFSYAWQWLILAVISLAYSIIKYFY